MNLRNYLRMDFVLDNKISIDSLLTLVLVFVFIIQTGYLIRQTNVGVRSYQANLRETWKKEFININVNLLIKNSKIPPDENEFKKLVSVFDHMRPLFRSKLLKPSDFAHTFMVLDGATGSETIRKSKTYKDEYFTLQHIYSHFNKDYDMIDYLLELPNMPWYDNILQKYSFIKKHDNLRKNMMDNWARNQKAAKFAKMFHAKVFRKPLFKLKSPL